MGTIINSGVLFKLFKFWGGCNRGIIKGNTVSENTFLISNTHFWHEKDSVRGVISREKLY